MTRTFSHIAQFAQSKQGKKTILFLSVFFYAVVILSFINPRPFLKTGYPGIFLFSLFGPASMAIPLLARHLTVLPLAIVASFGMAVNDSVSWLVGKSGDIILPRNKQVIRFENQVKHFGWMAIFLWALIPFPFDFIALIAGYLEMPFKQFFFPVFAGRLLRFIFMGAGTVALFGKIS